MTDQLIPNIGVYTICKNETKFVRQWVESMYCDGYGADRVYILDTGSTDGTVEKFREVLEELSIPMDWLKIEQKSYDQFRFDTARNNNLEMIGDDADWLDVLVSIDLDETMIPDFWNDLRTVIRNNPNFSRVYYLYAWNHDDNNNPKRVFWYDKIHPVTGCYWKHPVHEELVMGLTDRDPPIYLDENKIYLHHWADQTKSRSSYLPLLELRAEEEPDDIYGLFYLMREYTFSDSASIKALMVANSAYIRLSSTEGVLEDNYECFPFFILAMADIYKNLGMAEDAEHYYKKALAVASYLRQPYISYASFLAYQGEYRMAFFLLDEMEKKVPQKYSTWFETDYNWTWRPMQIRAVAECHAGNYLKAFSTFREAEDMYIKTPIDIAEANFNGFYDDYRWLTDYLGHKEKED